MAQEGELALQAKDLLEVGPIDFAGQQGQTAVKGALLDAAMAFIGFADRLKVEQVAMGRRGGKEAFDGLVESAAGFL